ncbi:unannotated protein [freshwater metagenome]|uniref:Unannotated protein n=1 Tax=freshwater metagenome TaxID=449393 RepID=A0A6J6SYG0_9ZZZZ
MMDRGADVTENSGFAAENRSYPCPVLQQPVLLSLADVESLDGANAMINISKVQNYSLLTRTWLIKSPPLGLEPPVGAIPVQASQIERPTMADCKRTDSSLDSTRYVIFMKEGLCMGA